MFIGHYSASFVAATHPGRRASARYSSPRKLIDYGFFSLMLADVEHMRLVPGITAMNAMDLYDMPWTHSLAGALGWALAFALLIRLVMRSWTAGGIAGAVVVSHWLIDLLVQSPGPDRRRIAAALGLGLWNHPAIEIPLELAFAYGGLAWFLSRTRATGMQGWLSAAMLAVTMAVSQYVNWYQQPASLTPAVPISGLAIYTVLALLAWWTASTRELKA